MLRRTGSIIFPLWCRRLCSIHSSAEKHKSLLGKLLLPAVANAQPRFLVPHVVTMSSMTPEMNLNYNDIVELSENKEIVLIDVREPHELEETGRIPGSTNIPLGDLKAALELSPDDFQSKYDIPHPTKDTPLVFSCRSGGRSTKALLTALELGFKKSRHYAGGYLDWEKNIGKQ